MEVARGAPPGEREQGLDARPHVGPRGPRLRAVLTHRGEWCARQVTGQRAGEDEVAVGEPLHERAGAETVGALVEEFALADREQPRDRAHQVVVYPQPAHRVVRGRRDAHGDVQRVVAGDVPVELEEVAIALAPYGGAAAGRRVAQLEGDRAPARGQAVA